MRVPFTLWRSLLWELARLTLLTSAVAVAVTGFAVAVKHFAEGQVGAADTLRIMALAAPAMLQFALPFSAGFAATLVYHRFTCENEAQAAAAAGVSHLALLAPAVMIGGVLSLLLAVLAQFVIPGFFLTIERIVTRDAARFIVNTINNGDSAKLSGLLIYADNAFQPEATDPDAPERVILSGVVAVAVGDEGQVESYVSAQRADLWFTTQDAQDNAAGQVSVVTMRLTNAVGRREGEGLGRFESTDIGPWIIPNAFIDNVKFRTLPQLLEMRSRPDMLGDVRRRRRALAATLAEERVIEQIRESLRSQRRVLLDMPDGRTLVVRASDMLEEGGGQTLAPLEGAQSIALDTRAGGSIVRRQTAEFATITVAVDPDRGGAHIALRLESVTTEGANSQRAQVDHTNLTLPEDPSSQLFTLPALELRRVARNTLAGPGAHEVLDRRTDQLDQALTRTRREITGNIHERFALAAACWIMTVTGAVMALTLRASQPLVVYLWAFLPAIAALVTISGGENAVAKSPAVGLVVIWSGAAALALYTALVYTRLRRH